MNNQLNEQIISMGKLAGLVGFMAFLYLNLLAGGVLTVAAACVAIRMVTGL